MGEVVRFDSPYWKGFYLPDGKQRWFYTDEQSGITVTIWRCEGSKTAH